MTALHCTTYHLYLLCVYSLHTLYIYTYIYIYLYRQRDHVASPSCRRTRMRNRPFDRTITHQERRVVVLHVRGEVGTYILRCTRALGTYNSICISVVQVRRYDIHTNYSLHPVHTYENVFRMRQLYVPSVQQNSAVSSRVYIYCRYQRKIVYNDKHAMKKKIHGLRG